MKKNILEFVKTIAGPARKFLGINHIISSLESLQREQRALTYQLDKANSYLEFAILDKDRLERSSIYQYAREIIPLLSPMDIDGATYRRFGRAYDGGYVMLDEISQGAITAAYSFGINDDASWDEAIAELGIKVFMYDHTIERSPTKHPDCRWFPVGVTGNHPSENIETLTALISKNGHANTNDLIVKMDIEGSEWNVVDKTPESVINQFAHIVIEFHGLCPDKGETHAQTVSRVLRKINKTHQSIHVHANSACEVSWLKGLAIPDLLEVTYVRRNDFQKRLVPNQRKFPTPIDQSTYPWLSDVPLVFS